MTYRECLDYLYSQLPIYQREGKAAYKVDLDNTIELLSRLNNPETQFKSIHIAGTNGKGSVSHMLASILQENGMKVGLYTSPHLKDFRERIKINGKDILENEVIDFVQKNRELVEDIHPSFFEWTVALAFHYFAEQGVDMAIVETGLGGRLDSTNVMKPEMCIITNIGFDHVQFLGDTLPKIAWEKAGIIKDHTPVVVGEFVNETRPVFEDRANTLHAPLIFAQDNQFESPGSDLKGPYQEKNIQTVLNGIEVLKGIGYEISNPSIHYGLNKVVLNTGLHGRWEFISKNPRVLVDMAHNKEGVVMVLSEIKNLSFDNLHMVWGMVNDKDVESILELLPKDATYYFCKANIPRGLDQQSLMELGSEKGLEGQAYSTVSDALAEAKRNANENDLIYVGGSTFVVAEVIP